MACTRAWCKYAPRARAHVVDTTRSLRSTAGCGVGRRVVRARALHTSTPARASAAVAPVAYDAVKQHDYDHYLCAKLLPSAARASAFTMRAFNLELAGVRDHSRGNATTAAMRFAFWREVVDAAYQGVEHPHPLAAPLREAVAQHEHTRRWLDRMIDARQEDIDRGAPKTMLELDTYGEHTQSGLLYLALEAVGVRDDKADEAASHIGRGVALANLLRSVPHHIRLQQRYLPDEVMSDVGLTDSALSKVMEDEEAREKLQAAVFQVACVAHAHVETARDLAPELSDAASAALLPAMPAHRFLKALEEANFDVLHPSLVSRSPLRLQAALLAAAFRNRFL